MLGLFCARPGPTIRGDGQVTKEEINDVLQASGLFAVSSPQDIEGIEETLVRISLDSDRPFRLKPIARFG